MSPLILAYSNVCTVAEGTWKPMLLHSSRRTSFPSSAALAWVARRPDFGNACRLGFVGFSRSQFSPQAGQFAAILFPLCCQRLGFGGQPPQFLTQSSQLRALLPELFDLAEQARLG